MEEKQHAGKQHVALLMQRGTSWKEAATAAGVHISRSTAYRWRSRLHVQGELLFKMVDMDILPNFASQYVQPWKPYGVCPQLEQKVGRGNRTPGLSEHVKV